ncbi:hypothetical protein FH972_027313 [Carpinus fangiana]|uniref:Uncharacterized protein n=1 Tax=Carpinus fangiana TaxID=176857 RepID=A0A5N6NXM7_9ROSI|nr:hypothetical protein FH972_027313 [Carpinus fangiana]
MEDTNKKSSGVGLDATPWPKSSIEAMPPFAVMAPSNLPLGTSSSFQVWKRPFLMNVHGDNGSGSSSSSRPTKIYLQPPDQPNSPPASTGDGVNKKTQNPSPNNSSEDGESNSIKAETVSGVGPRWCRNLDPDVDPKKLKR